LEALNVKPTMLLKVKDFAIFPVDLPVTMGPNAGFFKPKQWMHTGSKEVCAIFSL